MDSLVAGKWRWVGGFGAVTEAGREKGDGRRWPGGQVPVGYMGGVLGVSSSSHTDQKGSAQGVPEGRPGTAVKGTSLGGACSVYMSGLLEAESQLCRRALVTDWEHEPGRSREFSTWLVPKAD